MNPFVRKTGVLITITVGIFCSHRSQAANLKPKYGPEALLLSRSHAHIQKSAAPDFWALMPYYIPQQNERSCSLASVTMIVNGARSGRALGSDDELATQAGVLKRVKDSSWTRSLGALGRGVELERLGALIEKSLKAYGVDGGRTETVHVDNATPETLARVRAALAENEKSASDFIIANFDQKVFTDDTQVGHIAPVGAYDAESDRVLILDPDREWYEPYWISVATFVKGMATRDSVSKKNRGFVRVKTGPLE